MGRTSQAHQKKWSIKVGQILSQNGIEIWPWSQWMLNSQTSPIGHKIKSIPLTDLSNSVNKIKNDQFKFFRRSFQSNKRTRARRWRDRSKCPELEIDPLIPTNQPSISDPIQLSVVHVNTCTALAANTRFPSPKTWVVRMDQQTFLSANLIYWKMLQTVLSADLIK